MNLPNIITALVNSQNQYESHSYADCFTDNAVVFDERKTYIGKTEIENWISEANNEYKTIMKPLNYDEKENILSAEISGTFPGSPAILKYHFEFNNGLIQSLKITG